MHPNGIHRIKKGHLLENTVLQNIFRTAKNKILSKQIDAIIQN